MFRELWPWTDQCHSLTFKGSSRFCVGGIQNHPWLHTATGCSRSCRLDTLRMSRKLYDSSVCPSSSLSCLSPRYPAAPTSQGPDLLPSPHDLAKVAFWTASWPVWKCSSFLAGIKGFVFSSGETFTCSVFLFPEVLLDLYVWHRFTLWKSNTFCKTKSTDYFLFLVHMLQNPSVPLDM